MKYTLLLIVLGTLVASSAPALTAEPRLVGGLGTASIQPDTQNQLARAWFAQGERLVWAFDEVEAVRAFRTAQVHDPNCALCYWGEAWALKPTINARVRFEVASEASLAAEKARRVGAHLPERDRALVEAMAKGSKVPAFASRSYAEELHRLSARFVDDPVIAILAAEAQMSSRDWRDFSEGCEAQLLLQRALANMPAHTGAIHLYIHLTDWIRRPDLAQPYAEMLADLAPSASHLRHMPSHTYFGLGRYKQAVEANRAAAHAHRKFVSASAAGESVTRDELLAHSNYFGVFSALAAGDASEARRFLGGLRANRRAHGHHHMTAIAEAYIEALDSSVPGPVLLAGSSTEGTFERVLRHYSSGETRARLGDAEAVRARATALSQILEGPEAAELDATEQLLARMYEQVLLARAAALTRDYEAATVALRSAVGLQNENRTGSDPPLFWYPIRRTLAEVLLARGDACAALREVKLSLREWPNDSASLELSRRIAAEVRALQPGHNEQTQRPNCFEERFLN